MGIFVFAEITLGQLIFKTTIPVEIKGTQTGLSAFDNFLSQKGVTQIKPIKGMHQPTYYLASVSEVPPAEVLEYLFSGVQYVQPNYLRKLYSTPNDPLYGQQYHYISSIPAAWNYTVA